LIILITLGKA